MAKLTPAAMLAYSVIGVVGLVGLGGATGVLPVTQWAQKLTGAPVNDDPPVTLPAVATTGVQQATPAQTGNGSAQPEVNADSSDQAPAPNADTAVTAPIENINPQPDANNAAAEADVVTPVFDLLRVEPDGSVVIAGTAAPKASVEAFAGTRKLGGTQALDNGDFVIILDEQLAPGDYEIVLRADQPDGRSATSLETAIVSVPQSGADGVLALVEQPGVPSRLISSGEGAAPAMEPIASAKTETTDVADGTAPASAELAQEQPEIAAAPITELPLDEAQDAPPKAGLQNDVRIRAVEIDGSKLFVAGAANPGVRLNIYANSILLGTTKANPDGSFLIEVNRDLPVGDYMIRADALAANGVDVIVRAAVPFIREPGEKLAAIAAQAPERSPSDDPIVAPIAQAPTAIVPSAEALISTPPVIVTDDQAAAATQAALEPASSSVIIRRGDTLWQISRRVYGRGVKYSTIYEANADQIKNPNRIWPGQIFQVPEEPKTDG